MNPFKIIRDFISWKRTISCNENYVAFLRGLGVRIGAHTTFFAPGQGIIDTTRPWLIEIGDNVELTAGVSILTHGYDWSVIQHRDGDVLGSSGKVKIGNNVFIGVQSTLLKGTTIEDNVIIGAGSMVHGHLEANSVYAGNPARRICSVDEYLEKRRAAQIPEAVELVNEYRAVFHRDPPEEVLHEHFWLFMQGDAQLNETFRKKLAQRGNEEISTAKFRQNKPPFASYAAFLAYCTAQKEAKL